MLGIEDNKIDDEARRAFWRETGSVNERGEFKQWLHIFALQSDPTGEIPSVVSPRSLPWVNLMLRPDLEHLRAIHHMTKFIQYPSEWAMFGETLAGATARGGFGPYWMLLPRPDLQALAQTMVTLKRRIHNEMFRDHDPWNGRTFERRVVECMEPFLIYPMETINEADRTGEERL